MALLQEQDPMFMANACTRKGKVSVGEASAVLTRSFLGQDFISDSKYHFFSLSLPDVWVLSEEFISANLCPHSGVHSQLLHLSMRIF